MKQTLLLLVIVIFSLGLNAQIPTPQLKFILTGKLSGKNTKEVYLVYYDNVGVRIYDTCKVKNGNFSFTGFIKDPTPATLTGNTKPNRGANKIEIFIEPGKMNILLVENKYSQAKMIGSLAQKEFEQFCKKSGPLNLKTDSLFSISTNITENLKKETNTLLKEKLNKRLNEVLNTSNHIKHQLDQITISYIESHPDSYINPYVLYNSNIKSFDTLKMYYDKWEQGVKNSWYGFYLHTNTQRHLNTIVGRTAPDFETLDLDGKPLKLSNFRGKDIILLDFWASWCVYCRAQSPHLKELYSKYHTKGFDIIGISTDSKKEDWLNAIKQDSIDIWHQIPIVLNYNIPFNFKPTSDDLRFKYEWNPIPIQILIDKTGKIAGNWGGRSEENTKAIDKKLAELIGY